MEGTPTYPTRHFPTESHAVPQSRRFPGSPEWLTGTGSGTSGDGTQKVNGPVHLCEPSSIVFTKDSNSVDNVPTQTKRSRSLRVTCSEGYLSLTATSTRRSGKEDPTSWPPLLSVDLLPSVQFAHTRVWKREPRTQGKTRHLLFYSPHLSWLKFARRIDSTVSLPSVGDLTTWSKKSWKNLTLLLN